MTHAVTQVLNAAKTAVTGLALTGSNVFSERPVEHVLAETELPALRLYDVSELAVDYGFDGSGNDVFERTIEFRIEAVTKAKHSASPGNTSREIASAVETALAGHMTVGAAKVRIWYRGAEMIDSTEGDQQVVVRRMRFEAMCYTAANAPGTLLS